ncbi:alpha/beta hydrolase [Lactiplantibacillus sp. WILCCON 0030]|uniref:Alpha/beta hydrolase n=1 Tax=Lactiplantibacillus brownii TaxID=3069269 RepID=A0ABU1ACK7_9LACO|nr:alpha/beta hydrolase [Lactiplantibacillus brownii]MDQ7938060.1 alpha/beta hydrolase [Lactiplantibacillus brownii]
MSKRVKWGLIICVVFLLSIIGLGLVTQLHTDKTTHVITGQKRPLIMIAGSDSTHDDFDALIKSLNASQPHPVINVTVAKDLSVTATKTRVKNAQLNDTLIVIYFENSRDTNETIIQQTKGLANAMTYLRQHDKVTTANALGYSNGGLIFSRYVAGLATSPVVAIHDLMLVGTPFLGTSEAQPDETLYKPLLANKAKFNSLHTVINIAGDAGDGDDHVVPLSSVTAGSKLFMNEAHRYNAMTINQKNINHGDFLKEAYLARLVKQNLLNQ